MKRLIVPILLLAVAGGHAQDRSPDEQPDALGAALAWLVRHQHEDGSWRVTDYADCCGRDRGREGRCIPNPGDSTYDIGVTALAVLAFVWAGDADCAAVKNGLEWLAKRQDASGSMEGPGDRKNLYNHVLATLARVEHYRARHAAPVAPAAEASDEERTRIAAWIDQLSAESPGERERATESLSREFSKAEKILQEERRSRKDPEIVSRIDLILQRNIVTCSDPALGRALRYLLSIQNPAKGWRTFGPRDSNESSITGWAALALCGAARAKLLRTPQPIKGAIDWLDEVTADDGRVGYTERPAEPAEEEYPGHLSLIPLANLVRLAYGRSPSDMRGGAWLEKYPPVWDQNNYKTDFTYWFLGACYWNHMKDGAAWKEALRKQLVEHQVRLTGICRTGSWEPVDFWSESGGRVYITAMGALALLASEGRGPRFSVKP